MANPVTIQLDLDINLDTIRRKGQEVGSILERSFNKNTRLSALNHLERQIENVRTKVRSIQIDLQKAMTTQITTKPFKALEDAAADVHKELDVIIKDFAKNSKLSFEDAAKELRKSFDTGVFRAGMISFEDLEKLGDLYSKLDAISKKQDELRAKGQATFIDENAVKRLRNQLDMTSDQLHEMISRYQELSQQSGNSIINALQPISNFNAEIQQTATAIGTAFGPYVQIAVTAMQALVAVTEMEIKALKKMGEAVISAFKPLVSLAEMAAKAIGKMFDSIKKHNETTMKNLWRNVLRYGIGVRSMYFLIRKIRNEIGDAINQLAKQVPEVNVQLSAFKTAVNGLRGALATAFQPILTAILPALTSLINAVSRAIAVVGKFIALLTGQKFVYAATATQVDYAASLDKTGKSAKKAKKELEGYLSPIDEINKYQSEKDKDDDSSGAGGGGGDEAPYTLKKVPIEDWIKDFWDRLRKAWNMADFFDLGKELGDKIAKALASIPWDKIKNVARQLGKSLATLLNGIMSGEWDGKSLGWWIGRTLAEAINTGFEFANAFAKNFDWKKLGQTIVDTIEGVFENLDWNVITETLGELGLGLGKTVAEIFKNPNMFAEAGEALGKAANALVDMIYNFFNQQSGKDIGTAIAIFINSAFETFDAKDFGNTCNAIMLTLLDSLINAIGRTNWDQIGIKIAQVLNSIDFFDIFKKYCKLANNIIDAILDLLEGFLNTLTPNKIKEIGLGIAEAINRLNIQPKRLADVANRLLHALLDTILIAVNDIKWEKIGNDIVEFLDGIDWDGLLTKATTIWLEIKLGLATIFGKVIAWAGPKLNELIGKLVNHVKSWVKEKFGLVGEYMMEGFLLGLRTLNPVVGVLSLFNGILNAIKKLFGIESPSKVFEDIGKNIVLGLLNGLRDIVDKVKEIWEKLKAKTIEKFNEIRTKVVESVTALKEKAINLYENLKEKVTKATTELREKVVKTITDLKEKTIKTYENIKAKVIEKVTELKNKAIELYENLKNNVTENITELKENIIELYENIKASVIEKVTELKENVTELYENLKEQVIEKVTMLKERAIELYEDLKTSLIEKVQTLRDDMVEKYEEIKSNVVDKINALKEEAVEIYENIKESLISTVENIKETVVSVWEDMKTSVITVFNDLWDGIKVVINSILGGIESMVNGIIKGINWAATSLNKLQINPPEWIKSKYGIGSIGFDLPTLNEVSLPRLAQGAVIPPNKQFMAVLGDQTSGTNVETPLSTMIEAFNAAMRQSGAGRTEINFLLPDKRKVAQYVLEGGRIMQTSTGRNPFELI